MIKKIIFSFITFFLLLLITYTVNAAVTPDSSSGTTTLDPGEEIITNVPFQMFGVSCGLPGTQSSACCSKSLAFHIEKKDLEVLIAAINNGQYKNLSQEQTDVLESIFFVALDGELSIDEFTRMAFIKARIESGTQLTNEEQVFITNLLTQGAKKMNNLTGGEILKLQVRKTYPPGKDNCIIDIGIGRAFCTKGMSEFFAEILGDNPNFQSIIKSAINTPQEQCVFGTATNKGNSCICEGNLEAQLCNDYLSNTVEYGKCADCMVNKKGVWTGIGCVRTGSAAVFIQDVFLGWGIGLAGLIALICIIYSAFLLQTSQGNPERLKKAREYLTNCIIGLLIIIFAIFILRLIGVSILQIPGFGG